MFIRRLKVIGIMAVGLQLGACSHFNPVESLTATEFKQPDYYQANKVVKQTAFNQWQPVTILPINQDRVMKMTVKEKVYKKAYYFE